MIKKFLIIMMIVAGTLIAVPSFAGSAKAYNFFNGVDCTGAGQGNTNSPAKSTICNSDTKTDPISGPGGVILNAANVVSYVAGVAAVIILIVAGIRYVTSGGDPGNAKSARDTVMGAVIGLIVIVLARSLIIYVVNKLN
jgi:hypothetical protein